MITVQPGTIAVFSDIGCPWAHLAVFRLWRTRDKLGLADVVRFDHQAFPLEVLNHQPTPRRVISAEMPVLAGADPDAGWQVWQGDLDTWPVTMLPALEAVQAAKYQGLEQSEALDVALRRAFFAESRCISMRHVILEVAESCACVDVDLLAEALQDGRARRVLWDHQHPAVAGKVSGSPHLWLHDGSEVHNPGIDMHWTGEHGQGYPVIDRDDPGVYEDILRRAAGE